MLGGEAVRAEALEHAHRIATATGAKLIAQGANARVSRGRGRVPIDRIPYVVDTAVKALAGTQHVILCGLAQAGDVLRLPEQAHHADPAGRQHPRSRPARTRTPPRRSPGWPMNSARHTRLSPTRVRAPNPPAASSPRNPSPPRCAALLPDQAVVTDEAVTFGRGFFPFTYAAAPHDWLNSTGGAIGCGPPLATGAAVGAPGRRVVALQADGSAMYTLQALWTQARENLDVTTVLLSNRKYQILLGELANVGANPGRTALDMLDIGNPDLDWTKLAEGMGVAAARAETCERFADLFAQANARKGPFLIELVI